MPVACCTIARPQPISTTRRIHGTSRITVKGVLFVVKVRSACSTIASNSKSASRGVQAELKDAAGLGSRPLSPYQRGESGRASMPSSSATAGTAATANIMRHTCGSWMT